MDRGLGGRPAVRPHHLDATPERRAAAVAALKARRYRADLTQQGAGHALTTRVKKGTWRAWESGNPGTGPSRLQADQIDELWIAKLGDAYTPGATQDEWWTIPEVEPGPVSAAEPPATEPPASEPSATESLAVELPGAPSEAVEPTGARRRGRMAVGVLGVGIVVAAALVITVRDDDPAAAPCGAQMGEIDADVAQDPAASEIAASLRAVSPDAADLCAKEPAGRWGALVTQELFDGKVPEGALVWSAKGDPMWLRQGAYGPYRQIGGNTDAAQAVGGLPVELRTRNDGALELRLSIGGVMVAERADAPFFWINGAYVEFWRAHPELGLPTSGPMPSLRQDFEHGYAQVTGGADPVITLVSDPESLLPPNIEGRILHQSDGTSWWITGEGERKWIPDGPTHGCLGGDGLQIRPDVPGYAVATLPFAGVATCSDR